MSDDGSIQGLWRLVSCLIRGKEAISGTTHYLFDGDRFKAIDPKRVEDGDRETFELDPATLPKRFVIRCADRNKGEFRKVVEHWAYELNGDTCVFAGRMCGQRIPGRSIWADVRPHHTGARFR